MTMRKKYGLFIILVSVFIIASIGVYSMKSEPYVYQLLEEKQATKEDVGVVAKEHLTYITEEIGRRYFTYEEEIETAYYLKDVAEQLGYTVELQYVDGDRTPGSSYNVRVIKPGKNKEKIIMGAHMDSQHNSMSLEEREDAKGVVDNGGGVAVLLEVLHWLQDVETPYTVEVVFFAGEESRLVGSKAYVVDLKQEEKDTILFMMNLDGIIGYEYNYISNGANKKGVKYREKMIKLAKDLKLPFKIQEGKNKLYETGTTNFYSDQIAFDEAGIPNTVAHMGNFEVPPYDNYTIEGLPLLKNGERVDMAHTKYDNLTFIEENMPGHIDENLNIYSLLVLEILLQPEW